jgi:hypothetical protein
VWDTGAGRRRPRMHTCALLRPVLQGRQIVEGGGGTCAILGPRTSQDRALAGILSPMYPS